MPYTPPTYAGMEIIVKDVALLRTDAQNEMFLADDSSHTRVVGELRQLAGNLKRAAEEVGRINKYQKLFKVKGQYWRVW